MENKIRRVQINEVLTVLEQKSIEKSMFYKLKLGTAEAQRNVKFIKFHGVFGENKLETHQKQIAHKQTNIKTIANLRKTQKSIKYKNQYKCNR